jgi:glucuronate isomerase
MPCCSTKTDCFPSESSALKVARSLYAHIRNLPIVSPHGHTQASWFATNEPFPDPATLLCAAGPLRVPHAVQPGRLNGRPGIGQPVVKDPRKVWRIFASHYYLFRGTPTRIWLDFAFQELFGMKERLSEKTADLYFRHHRGEIEDAGVFAASALRKVQYRVLSTTESPLDPLKAHQAIRDSGWKARIVPAFRPDAVVDPEFKGFAGLMAKLGEQNGEDSSTWKGYLNALMKARARFKALGCTSTDHGHPTAQTADLPQARRLRCSRKVIAGKADAGEQELFRAQMLTEMARMSVEDGLVMQIHPGSVRNHNKFVYERYGRDMGADIPGPTDFVHALRPLLDRFGNDKNLTIILFMLDESTISRELAPLAGALSVLAPWTPVVVS